MSLSELTDTSTILAAIALVVTAILLFQELRMNNKLTRAANNQALVRLSSPFNMGLIQDRKTAEFYVNGAKEFATMDEVDQFRYRTLLIWWLILYENIYYQWQHGLLDDHSYQPWSEDLAEFVGRQRLAFHWDVLSCRFQEEFSEYIRRQMEANDEPNSTAS